MEEVTANRAFLLGYEGVLAECVVILIAVTSVHAEIIELEKGTEAKLTPYPTKSEYKVI